MQNRWVFSPAIEPKRDASIISFLSDTHGWQDGGGLYIDGTATLTGSNVYENEAGEVCSPV